MNKSPERRYKDAMYEQFARLGKAVSAPARLELLDLLCQGPRTVEALAEQSGLSFANTSSHLQMLRAARLVDAEKDGLYVTYRLADEEVCRFFRSLRHLAEKRLAEVERTTREFLERRGELEPVDQEELLQRVRRGEVTVLDVRPIEEYQAGHLAGALSVPLDELEQRLGRLPRRRAVVAYCRGPYCVLAIKAVEMLRGKGFKAFRLADGIPEMREKGLAVENAEEQAGDATR